MRLNAKILLAVGFASTLLLASTSITLADGPDCEMDNRALQTMEDARVTVITPPGRKVELDVKLAGTYYTRAQGFQKVCAERIAQTPILFTFGAAVLPSFHMRNVVAPIDIVFLKVDGSVDSFHAMQPYTEGGSRPQYAPNDPIVAALEVRPGLFSDEQITADSVFTWEVVKAQK